MLVLVLFEKFESFIKAHYLLFLSWFLNAVLVVMILIIVVVIVEIGSLNILRVLCSLSTIGITPVVNIPLWSTSWLTQ